MWHKHLKQLTSYKMNSHILDLQNGPVITEETRINQDKHDNEVELIYDEKLIA